tara:strand:+ start:14672 stop:17353 length:2682 start_codon:yes stop_codon:yes gene_type:complete
MLLSHSPFEQTIPFASLEKIGLKNHKDGQIALQLQISNETSRPLDRMEFSNLVVFSPDKMAVDSMAASLPAINTLIRNPSASVRKKSFSLTKSDFVQKGLTDATSTRSMARQSIYSNSHKMTVALPRTENLYVMVVAYRQYKEKIFVGSIIKETIIKNNAAPLRAKIYRLAETLEPYGVSGSIWPGAVHRHNNTLMAGVSHSPSIPHPRVTATSAPNYKIVDKRFLTAAQNLNFDNESTRTAAGRLFSDVTLSRSEEGMVHGSVSFDLLSYAKNNSTFGRLIKSDAALLSAFGIDDAVVYRRVVNPGMYGNSLTPAMTMKCNIQGTTSYEPVATLGKELRTIVIDAANNNGIVPMSFIDKDAQNLNGGAVQYKLELVFSDKTHEAVTYIRDGLLTSARSYQPGQSDGWEVLVDDYLAAVSFVFGSAPFETYPVSTWRKNLLALAKSPVSRKIDHQTIITTVETFVNGLSGLLSVPLSGDSSPQDFRSKIYVSKKESLRRIVKILANNYVIVDRKNVGISYIGKAVDNKRTVIPTMGHKSLLDRINTEVTKYSVANSNAVSVNKFGYVSPETLLLANTSIDTTTLSASTDAFSPLIRSNTSNRIKFAPDLPKTAQENKSNILSNLSIGAMPLQIDLQKVISVQRRGDDAIDSDQYLGSGSVFVRADNYLTAKVSGSNSSIIQKDDKKGEIFNSTLVNNLVEKSTLGFKNGMSLTNKSVIEGSLALSKFVSDQNSVSDLNPISRNVNFNTVAKMEYLQSYDATLRCGKLNWQLLDEATWTRASASDRTLLCRLVKTSNVLDAPEMLKLEPLGSLFALGTPKNIPPSPNYKRQLSNVRSMMTKSRGNNGQDTNSMMIYYATNTPMTAVTRTAQTTTTTTQTIRTATPKRTGRTRRY